MTSPRKSTSLLEAKFIRTRITISHCAPEKPHFGIRVDTNESVYINSRLSRLTDFSPGDQVTALVTQNTRNSETVPWYALEIEESISRTGFGLAEVVSLLTRGGVWSGVSMAEALNAPDMAGHASALLEVAYQQAHCNKIVEFGCSQFRQERAWFAGCAVETDLLDLSDLEDVT